MCTVGAKSKIVVGLPILDDFFYYFDVYTNVFFFFSKYSGELQEHKYVSKTVCLGRAVLQELVSQKKCMEIHIICVYHHFDL